MMLDYTSFTRRFSLGCLTALLLSACASTSSNHSSSQSELLAQQISQLQATPQDASQSDIYYLGVAGSSDINAFSNEVSFTNYSLAQHVTQPYHALMLDNHYYSREKLAQATVSHIGQALQAIAQQMDTQQDVLVLHLTSHGRKDTGFWLYNAGQVEEYLSPQQLSNYLTSNQIKWKIIIISACYSGQFIAPLADDYSLIMTASDAQNPSFGCTSGTEMTYFGKALLQQGIAKGLGWSQAFDNATPQIVSWETSLGFGHSNPQRHLGPEMAKKLQQLTIQ